MPKGFTSRGFAIYDEFRDSYNHSVKIQESSNAGYDAVWIFAQNEDGDLCCSHLNMDQAKRLRDALDEFIRDHEHRCFKSG